MTDINRLREDAQRLQEEFIPQAIELRKLQQGRRYDTSDEAVEAARERLEVALTAWKAAVQRLQEAGTQLTRGTGIVITPSEPSSEKKGSSS